MNIPLIGVTACVREEHGQKFHHVGDKYLQAVVAATGALPVIVPAFGDRVAAQCWIEKLDGLLVTGSPSNVAPSLYGQTPHEINRLGDPDRDATTLPLIRAALQAELPLLAICRGFQELNVATGGTLHQAVHLTGSHFDHRDDHSLPLAQQYAPAHDITLCPGGVLAGLDLPPRFAVNSLHSQGVDTLSPALQPEALADDGLVEAVSLRGARHFALGVQFHPEWEVTKNPHYLAIFHAFSAACLTRARARAV